MWKHIQTFDELLEVLSALLFDQNIKCGNAHYLQNAIHPPCDPDINFK